MRDRSRLETAASEPMAAEVYSQRDSQAFADTIALNAASREVPFFLAHLRPGMAVVDVGCGPGTITLGLAEVVAPAEVIGVDLQPAMVEQSGVLAAERNLANARFEVANVYELPFPSGSFDAALALTLLIGCASRCRHSRSCVGFCVRGVVGVRDPD